LELADGETFFNDTISVVTVDFAFLPVASESPLETMYYSFIPAFGSDLDDFVPPSSESESKAAFDYSRMPFAQLRKVAASRGLKLGRNPSKAALLAALVAA
jgi:hypothetical protein